MDVDGAGGHSPNHLKSVASGNADLPDTNQSGSSQTSLCIKIRNNFSKKLQKFWSGKSDARPGNLLFSFKALKWYLWSSGDFSGLTAFAAPLNGGNALGCSNQDGYEMPDEFKLKVCSGQRPPATPPPPPQPHACCPGWLRSLPTTSQLTAPLLPAPRELMS